MATKYVIYTYPDNFKVDICLIAAEYGGIRNDCSIYPNFEWGVTHKTEEFLKFSPLGNVPAMTTPEGGVCESLAMARYLARAGNDSGLMGTTNHATSSIDAWLDLITDMTGNFKIYPLFGWAYPDWETPFNQEKFNDSKDMAKKVWDCIGKHLERNNQEYLVGDRVTLADIVVAGYFVKPLHYALDADFRKDYPKTEAYLRKLYETKEFKAVIGDLKFIDKFEPPK